MVVARPHFKGRTLVLKVKLHTYEVLTRQVIPPKAVQVADDLYTYALPMMAKLEREIPGMKLRLMGLRCTNLVSTKKGGIDFFGMPRRTSSTDSVTNALKRKATAPEDSDAEWEVWPDTEFEAAARQELQDEMNELEQLSQEEQREESNRRRKHGREILPNPSPNRGPNKLESIPRDEEYWDCPICARPQVANDKLFNEHVDFCLSRQTIKEAVRDTSPTPGRPPEGKRRKIFFG